MKKGTDIGSISIKKHRKLGGKIEISSKGSLRSMRDLSIYYTPGVGAVSALIARDKKHARALTIKKNTVAVISDGSAVLGLGNVGPLAALPVMEGKAMLFKELAGIDAFPLVLDTQDIDEIIAAVKAIAPTFAGINLEDISAPRCFEIEERLKKELPIPVMHDDQHGTAIVVLAGLINAFKVVKKDIKKATIVIIGAGAAGTATAKLLSYYGVGDIIVIDSTGIISRKRKGMPAHKKDLAKITNKKNFSGSVLGAMEGADVLIGVSGAGKIKKRYIRSMAQKPIVFALANPTPEIMPDAAYDAGAYIVATGRSDFENQINNVLVFPGVFRGAIDSGVRDITDTMKIRAAQHLAALIKKPTRKKIIPGVLDRRVARAVASAFR